MFIKRYTVVGLVAALTIGGAVPAHSVSGDSDSPIAAALRVAAEAVAYAVQGGGQVDDTPPPPAAPPPEPGEASQKGKTPPGQEKELPDRGRPEPPGRAKKNSERETGRERAASAIAEARSGQADVMAALVAGAPPSPLEAEPGMGSELDGMVKAFNTLAGFEAGSPQG